MKNKFKGFTLVELLVVISIIAMLLAIMVPTLNKAREKSRQVICSSNQKSLGQLLMLYAHTYKDTYPIPFANWDEAGVAGKTVSMYWVACLRTSKLIRKDQSISVVGGGDAKDFWACPSSDPKKENPQAAGNLGQGVSIGMNDGYTNFIDPDKAPVTGDYPGDAYFSKGINVTKIKDAGRTVLAADIRARWVVYTWRWYSSGSGPRSSEKGGCFMMRHSRKASNFLLADGHVQAAPAEPDQIKLNVCRPKIFKYHYNDYESTRK